MPKKLILKVLGGTKMMLEILTALEEMMEPQFQVVTPDFTIGEHCSCEMVLQTTVDMKLHSLVIIYDTKIKIIKNHKVY